MDCKLVTFRDGVSPYLSSDALDHLKMVPGYSKAKFARMARNAEVWQWDLFDIRRQMLSGVGTPGRAIRPILGVAARSEEENLASSGEEDNTPAEDTASTYDVLTQETDGGDN